MPDIPTTDQGSENRAVTQKGVMIFDKYLVIPVGNTTPEFDNLVNKGLIRVNSDTDLLEYFNGDVWVSVNTGDNFWQLTGGNNATGSQVITGGINVISLSLRAVPGQVADLFEAIGPTGIVESRFAKDGALVTRQNIFGISIVNINDFRNSRVMVTDSGTKISRDRSGAGTTLIVEDLNKDSTGKLIEFRTNIEDVNDLRASIEKTGNINIPNGIAPSHAVNLSQLQNVSEPIIEFKYPLDYSFRPFKVLEQQGVFYTDKSVKDIVSDKISKMKPYYLNYTSGSNSNNGLTEATAFKTVTYALTQGAQLIYLADKDVIQADGWGALGNNSTYGNKDIFVISKGRTYILNNLQSLVYTLDTGSTYVTTIGSSVIPNIVDFKHVNEYGFPLTLKKQTSIANVNSTPNSYFIIGTSLYVNLKDNRAPDSQLYVLKSLSSSDTRFLSNGSEYFYGENLSFLGGTNALSVKGTSVGTGLINALLNKCHFLYASENGLGVSLTEGLIWSENCIAYDNGRDGFNYIQNPSGTNEKVIETYCLGFNNGINTSDISSALNGSSVHNKVTVLRVGGKYFGNRGPNVIDVNGAKSLNVGVECFDSRGFSDVSNNPTSPGVNWPDWGDFGVGTIATEAPTKMWLYGCKSKDTRLSFATPVYLSDNITLDGSTIYVDKSYCVSPYLNNVVFGAFTPGVSLKYDFPALSSFTAPAVGDIMSVVKDTALSTTITGTTSETILKSYLISGGTFASSDIININAFRIVKSGAAGIATMRIYINTISSLSGAVQIAQYNTAAANLTAKMTRSFCLIGGNITGLIFNSTTLLSDVEISNATISTTTLNPANNFYIITTIQLANGADSVYQNEFRITN